MGKLARGYDMRVGQLVERGAIVGDRFDQRPRSFDAGDAAMDFDRPL